MLLGSSRAFPTFPTLFFDKSICKSVLCKYVEPHSRQETCCLPQHNNSRSWCKTIVSGYIKKVVTIVLHQGMELLIGETRAHVNLWVLPFKPSAPSRLLPLPCASVTLYVLKAGMFSPNLTARMYEPLWCKERFKNAE